MGDRRHGKTAATWRSSVLDSVVGTFLTQNVSDVLSSNAFMSLRSRFPAKRTDIPIHVALSDRQQEWDVLMDPDGGEKEENQGEEGDFSRLYVQDDVDWHAVRTAPVQEVGGLVGLWFVGGCT